VLTHVVDLHQVVPVVVVVDALDADCEGTGLTEVFYWLVRVHIARNKVSDLNRPGVQHQAEDLMIKFEVLRTVLVPNLCKAERALFYRLILIL
jgi:hypothetical protein